MRMDTIRYPAARRTDHGPPRATPASGKAESRYTDCPRQEHSLQSPRLPRTSMAILAVPLAVMLLAFLLFLAGCGLGYIDVTPASTLDLRVENAAPDTVEVKVVLLNPSAVTVNEQGSTIEPEPTETVVILRTGDVSEGNVVCHEQIVVTVTNASGEPLTLTGDGTGTPGFDEGSVGPTGERFLLLGEHFTCEDSLVVQLATSTEGTLSVVSSGEPFPEAITGTGDSQGSSGGEIGDEGGGGGDESPGESSGDNDDLLMRVVNETESTVQINFAAGDGNLTDGVSTAVVDEFDVRIPPFTSTTGPAICAVEYIVAASHLESTGTTFSEGSGTIFEGDGSVTFHAVVLTGDGTGTEGFDSNTIAVTRGRLLQRGAHYDCGDEVVVTVIATNNQLQLDEEGNPALDEFGNPTILFNVGFGNIEVVD